MIIARYNCRIIAHYKNLVVKTPYKEDNGDRFFLNIYTIYATDLVPILFIM